MPQIRTDLPLIPLSRRSPERYKRQLILRETLELLRSDYSALHQRAAENISRWRSTAQEQNERGELKERGRVELYDGDWGEVTLALSKREGETFAALNMANAHGAGGAYQSGSAAQEENMFRRSDCHFALHAEELTSQRGNRPSSPRYTREMTALLNAEHGRVYLDLDQPRVCVRGPEIIGSPGEGYPWLSGDDIFPFYELRAAAVDLRHLPGRFDPSECARRFNALLDTLKEGGVDYAVLGAHGCGAFMNPSEEVARVYAETLRARRDEFSLIAFAIFYAGYGPNNYEIFSRVFAEYI